MNTFSVEAINETLFKVVRTKDNYIVDMVEVCSGLPTAKDVKDFLQSSIDRGIYDYLALDDK